MESTGNTLSLNDASGQVARPDSNGTFRAGTFSWTINVHWKPAGVWVPSPPKFTTVTTLASVDASGEVCVTKSGAGPTCKALGTGGDGVPQIIVERVNHLCGN